MYVNGSVVSEANGFIRNTGSISVNGNITNNGITFFSDSSSGVFYLNGTHQIIGGVYPLHFHKLILNTADTLTLQQSIKATDSLNFFSGYINLNGNTIDLDTTGSLANERLSSHIFGLSGKVTARKYINHPDLANDIAGLGLKIKSNHNHGLVIIERSHYQQPAADTSIFRFYKITSQYTNSIDSITVSYFNTERFKQESDYKIFTKKVSGINGWKNKGGTENRFTKCVSAGSINIDTTLITIANQTCAIPPDINLPGIINLLPLMSIDTITCAKDTLNINAYSSASNAQITWRDSSGNIFSNPMQVSAPSSFFIDVENGMNGCTNTIPVIVTQNKVAPQLNALSDSVFLNCSQTSLQLTDTSLTAQTPLTWTGPNNFISADPATITKTGKYYVTASRATNGCITKDSVIVGFQSKIILTSNHDTLVCKNSTIHLSTSALGSVSGVNYVWNNGIHSSNAIVNPVITTTYIVSATSPGCSGKDTVIVTIPPPITDSVTEFQSCNGTKTGTIFLNANGGIPPYLYSINFSPLSSFNNIPYGNYSVLIKDSLGCTKSNTAVLSGLSKLPVPEFIASTRNTKGDTIVLVDISSPKPDSVSWLLPPHAVKIGGDMFDPIIYLPDTGAFVVTMIGYFGDCKIDTTKLIHFSAIDTSVASEYNNNGIRSITLYPNPNKGSFTIGLEFYKKQNSSIQIWDTSPKKYFQQNFTNADLISLPVILPQLINGTYILRVIGEFDMKSLNFIISH